MLSSFSVGDVVKAKHWDSGEVVIYRMSQAQVYVYVLKQAFAGGEPVQDWEQGTVHTIDSKIFGRQGLTVFIRRATEAEYILYARGGQR